MLNGRAKLKHKSKHRNVPASTYLQNFGQFVSDFKSSLKHKKTTLKKVSNVNVKEGKDSNNITILFYLLDIQIILNLFDFSYRLSR